MTPAHDPLLTLSEAAELLGYSTRSLRRWAAEGQIDYVRPAGGRRGAMKFRESALTDFLSRNTKRATANQRRGPGRPRKLAS